ncbi:MAG: hypothetical protein JXR34_14000, partial [Bacteroidales bacterium]|nr:hypothetical protein [Bacteroidales bacterium]
MRLLKGFPLFWMVVFSLFSQQLNSQANSIKISDASFRLHDVDMEGFEMTLSVGDMSLENVKAENQYYHRLVVDGFTKSLEEGSPELPIFNRLFEVPAGAKMTVEILDKTFTEIHLDDLGFHNRLFPHQLSAPKLEGYEQDFAINKAVYQSDSYFGFPIVQTSLLGMMRNYHIAQISISPFEYNPVRNILKVTKSIKIRVHFDQIDYQKMNSEKSNYSSNAFSFVEKFLINADAYKISSKTVQQAALRLVIITDSNFYTTLLPFIKMKQRQGFEVITAFTQNSQVGSTNASIKSYLLSLYNNSSTRPDYVILVGDVAEIPAFPSQDTQVSSAHITDLYYFEYTNDYFPEVLYGRFSCENLIELQNLLEKTIMYEKYSMPDDSYMNTSVLIAGYDGAYGPTHGNGQVNYGINTYYNSTNGIVGKSYLFPSSASSASQIKADANAGAAMLNYSAHGNYNGWDNPSFKNNDVGMMTNLNKYPVMIGNACLTGKFDMSDCFGEVLTIAPQKGAVGYIGASNNSYWDEDFYWAVGYSTISANPTFVNSDAGIFDGINHTHGEPFNEWSTTLGQIVNKGNMAVTQGGSRVRYYWEIYHCFGDPSLVHHTKKASPVSANYSALIPIGSASLIVNTEPNSLVSLTRSDSLLASTYADSTGAAQLLFSPLTQMGSAILHISGQNLVPYIDTLDVMVPNTPYLYLFSHQINDSLGNGNHIADFGEDIFLDLKLTNLTSIPSGPLSVYVYSNDTSILFLDSIATLNGFAGLDSLVLKNEIKLHVNQVIMDGKMVKFFVEITDTAGTNWNYFSHFIIHAPKLTTDKMLVDDASLGNGDGILDAGELIKLSFKVSNVGSGKVINLTSTLSFLNNTIVSTEPPVIIPSLDSDSSHWVTFNATVNSSATAGKYAELSLLTESSGYLTKRQFYLVVGNMDEDFETGDLTKYPWIGDGNASWTVVNSVKHTGAFSALSDSISDNQNAGMFVNMNVLMDDSISFFYKVSSEDGYDFLNFYMDNALIKQWSGEEDW